MIVVVIVVIMFVGAGLIAFTLAIGDDTEIVFAPTVTAGSINAAVIVAVVAIVVAVPIMGNVDCTVFIVISGAVEVIVVIVVVAAFRDSGVESVFVPVTVIVEVIVAPVPSNKVAIFAVDVELVLAVVA